MFHEVQTLEFPASSKAFPVSHAIILGPVTGGHVSTVRTKQKNFNNIELTPIISSAELSFGTLVEVASS